MDDILQAIWETIVEIGTTILNAIKEGGLWLMGVLVKGLQSLFYWLFDRCCALVEWIFSLIDFKNEIFEDGLAWTSLPDQMIWILNQVGVDNGIIILGAALLIRVSLNLIPSWGTRV